MTGWGRPVPTSLELSTRRWHEYGRGAEGPLTSAILYHMKKTLIQNNSQTGEEQGAVKQLSKPQYEIIKLGIDWHADHLRVVRMIDGSGPEPAQRFSHP